MIWLVLGLAAAIAAGSLWLGRKWGLATGRKRTEKALRTQQTELLRQSEDLRQLRQQRDSVVQKINEADSFEEVADELAKIHADWSANK